jgi:hypothetical protein
MATPVDPQNRMHEIEPSREIEVRWHPHLQYQRPELAEQGWTRFDFPGRGNKVRILTLYPCCGLTLILTIVQRTEMDP